MHGATKWAMSFASELVNQGHDSKLVCARFNIDKPYWFKADLIVAKFSLKPSSKLFRVLANYLNILSLYWLVPKDSDVIVFHAEASTSLLPFMRLRCPNAKLVYFCYQPPREVYDLWPLLKKDYSLPVQLILELILPFYRLLDKFLVRRAELVLVSSDKYEEYVRSIYLIDCIDLMPAGVDFNVFAEYNQVLTEHLRERYDSADHIILMNATLTRKKRVDLLIRSLAELKKKGMNVHAIVIGEGDLKEELLNLAASLEVRDRLHLMGYITQEELPCYYFIADILFYLEPKGAWTLSIIEAGAASLPVVVAAGGSMTTMVNDGESGIILSENADEKNISDIAITLFQDEQKLLEMGRNNYQHSIQFSLDVLLKKFVWMVE